VKCNFVIFEHDVIGDLRRHCSFNWKTDKIFEKGMKLPLRKYVYHFPTII